MYNNEYGSLTTITRFFDGKITWATTSRGLLNTSDLGMMVSIWASLGLEVSNFHIFDAILSFFVGKLRFCLTFFLSKSGVDKMATSMNIFFSKYFVYYT